MQFDFTTTSQILFGPGKIRQLGVIAKGLGKKALIIAGYRGEALENTVQALAEQQIPSLVYQVSGEPTIAMIDQARSLAVDNQCDFVIGFGGGSALDTAKAAAAMATNPGPILEYLEVVGANRPITQAPLPWIAVPTTAGTGSEVTRNAVIAVPDKKVKVSMRSPMMLARLALIDPELMISLPQFVTACTGMDALAQVIEPFVSQKANPFVDLFCLDGIRRGTGALRKAFHNGGDLKAREDMAFTSLMGGLALANAGLGAVHGFAGPIGGMFDAPHGAVCACLLPPVVGVNARALAQRDPHHPAVGRYVSIAQAVTGFETAEIGDLIAWLESLRKELNIPSLSTYGIHASDFDALVQMASAASSMKANPISLRVEELREILEMAL